MKLIILGSGTSSGVPSIGCSCKVCRSKNPKDKRLRSSAYVIGADDTRLLIDVGPEFRLQALRSGIKKIDAVLLTHSHADHLHGIDDLRSFSSDMYKIPEKPESLALFNAPPIPIYTNQVTIDDLRNRFSYIFNPVKEGGGHAKLALHVATGPFSVGGITVMPVPMLHGHLETTGWLLSETDSDGTKKSMAYLTDCSFISDESIEKIRSNCGTLTQLVIDGLRIEPHSTHFSFLEALDVAQRLGAERVWLTHLNHSESHRQIKRYVRQHIHEFPGLSGCKSVLPAYDMLVLK